MRFIKLIVVLIGLFCFSANVADAQTNTAETSVSKTAVEAVAEKTIKVKVKGVGCSRDLKAIMHNVGSVIGVRTCETLKKGATTTFSVSFNPTVATEQSIYSAVEATPGCSNQSARPYKVKLK